MVEKWREVEYSGDNHKFRVEYCLMFIGEYQNSIDSKGRIIVPSKFRDQLGSKFILTKGLDNCLYIYPMDEWNKFQDKLTSLPVANKDARAFVRYFFSSAVECEIDKQGRLTIPQNLREHARIDKELVTIGVLSKIEIWSKQEWDNYSDGTNLGPDEIAEKMSEFGI